MKIIIAGGTGQLGSLLQRDLTRGGTHVVLLSRNVEAPAVHWDGKTIGAWAKHIDGADVVINLAGRSVHGRYDAKTRHEIMTSRVDSTRVIGEAIGMATNPPRVWLQMSTATIYAHSFDTAHDEWTGVIGGNEPDVPEEWHFSIEVAHAWEKALDDAATPHTRKVKLRTAMVMAAGRGGTFALLRRHVRMGFGRFGDGRQYISWIHEHDFVRAVEWIIEHEEIGGVVNIAAPEPLPNARFMSALREECGGLFGVPTSGWVLELGAFVMRTEPELILKSRRVVPARLSKGGFRFAFPEWTEAARDLCARHDAPAGVSVW